MTNVILNEDLGINLSIIKSKHLGSIFDVNGSVN